MEMFLIIISVVATVLVLIAFFLFLRRKREPRFNEEAEQMEREKMEDESGKF
jgi:uncharacterized membrane protein